MATGWTRRDFLFKGSLTAGAVLAAPSLLSACSKSDSGSGGKLDQLKSQGTITIGISGEQPYSFLDGGELTGEDPTVQKEIWKRVGIDNVKPVRTGFDSLIPGLNAGNFDVVAAGMFITPDRCKEAQFSDPMYCAPEAFLVPSGNPANLSDFASAAAAGVKIGVLGGAVEGGYAADAGVSKGNIVTIPDQQAGLLQLQQGRIDAIALTSISLNWLLKQNPDANAEVTEPFTPTDKDGNQVYGCGAAVFRQADDDLVQAFNQQLSDMISNDELTPLIEQFGFGAETLPPSDLTTEKLCSTG